jgi:hypothetical protein
MEDGICRRSPFLLKEKGQGDEVHWIERSENGGWRMEETKSEKRGGEIISDKSVLICVICGE